MGSLFYEDFLDTSISLTEVEDSIYGLSDTLYFQCSSAAIAEKKLKMWSRRKRKKGWRLLYDKD